MTDPQTPGTPAIPHADPDVSVSDDTQITYYQGSPRLRGELGMLFTWTLVGLGVMAVPILLRTYTDVRVPWWLIAAGVVVGLLCWVMPGVLVRRDVYRITNYRIDVERGLFFKDFDTLELWHVEDVALRQSPLDRIFNLGTITVISGDATNPKQELRSLSNPRQLLETLKTRIIAVKRQRGVVKIDAG